MNFNKHFHQEGKHALLSASSWRWLHDDSDSLVKRIKSQYSTTIGTILHNIAYKHIKYRIKMNRYDKKNVMLVGASAADYKSILSQLKIGTFRL
jgi:hypothetical protein